MITQNDNGKKDRYLLIHIEKEHRESKEKCHSSDQREKYLSKLESLDQLHWNRHGYHPQHSSH